MKGFQTRIAFDIAMGDGRHGADCLKRRRPGPRISLKVWMAIFSA